jgi:L-rhamnose isomerase / sugar isomerase
VRRSRASCGGQETELPSWAFGNSGTRFKVFAQPGVPRDPYEKIADAAQVHEYTGVAPRVSLHIPWDRVDDYAKLTAHADDLGVRIGAINSNLLEQERIPWAHAYQQLTGAIETSASLG